MRGEKAVGYIRVSTTGQVEDGVSLELQKSKIQQYCDLHDLELVEVIADEGLSGRTLSSRPGIQAIQKQVRKKEVTNVIVYSLSRLARNTRECLNLSEEMDRRGVSLHSITEKLDTKSSLGRFYFRLMASLAEMESDQISERTSAAMVRLRQKNQRISRYAPFGYEFQGDQVIPVEKEQVVVRKILSLSNEGYSLRQISKNLSSQKHYNRDGKPFNPGSLHCILKRERASEVHQETIRAAYA